MRRKLREKSSQLLSLERSRAPVDLNDDVSIVAKAHLVRLVDFDKRNVFQHVDSRSSCNTRHVLDAVDIPVGRQHLLVAFCLDLLALELRYSNAGSDGTDIHDRLIERHHEILARDRLESNRPEPQRILARRQTIHTKRSVRLRQRAANEDSIALPPDRY